MALPPGVILASPVSTYAWGHTVLLTAPLETIQDCVWSIVGAHTQKGYYVRVAINAAMNDESPPINEEKHINNNNEQESIQTQNTLSIYGSHLYAREHLARTRGKVDAGDAGRRLTEQQLRLGRLFPCCCALFDAVRKREPL